MIKHWGRYKNNDSVFLQLYSKNISIVGRMYLIVNIRIVFSII